jgi:uncharacterized protein
MQPKTHHNLRQRKKLRLGEFQQLGFSISGKCPEGWSDEQREQAMSDLIDRIENRELDYGGGDSASGMDGYVVASGRGSATEDDREALRAALGELGFVDVEVGALEDAWYPPNLD